MGNVPQAARQWDDRERKTRRQEYTDWSEGSEKSLKTGVRRQRDGKRGKHKEPQEELGEKERGGKKNEDF